jgi:uncharacterized repeat protein (TIGR03803 family)
VTPQPKVTAPVKHVTAKPFLLAAPRTQATPGHATKKPATHKAHAASYVETVLYSFEGTTDGSGPLAGVIQGADGNYYGATSGLNADSEFVTYGSVYKVSSTGTYTTLYNFCSLANCADGAYPIAGLTQGGDGNLYGTTLAGGLYGSAADETGGTIFKISLTGTLTTLYNFCAVEGCTDGELPDAAPTQGTDGNYYGTAFEGGSEGVGTIWQLTPAGVFTALYSFCSQDGCTDGEYPRTQLLEDSSGYFYGTTEEGGEFGAGVVYQYDPSTSTVGVGYSFCEQEGCTDGEIPIGNIVQDGLGNFYGSTAYGGTDDDGTIWQLQTSDGLTFVNLYNFCTTDCSDGAIAYSGVILGSDGNLYGTAVEGGSYEENEFGGGTAFQVTTAGAYTNLYQFCQESGCTDGAFPESEMIQGSDGNFYGATFEGGDSNAGTVYAIDATPANTPPVVLTVSPTFGSAGSAATITFSVYNAFIASAQQCYGFTNGAAGGAFTGVQMGTLTDGVYSGTATVTQTAGGEYVYSLTCGGSYTGTATQYIAGLTVNPSTISVNNPGDSVSTLMTLVGFVTPAATTFSCSNLPRGATCSFSSVTITGPGAGTAIAIFQTNGKGFQHHGDSTLAWTLPGMLAIVGLFTTRRRHAQWRKLFVVVLLLSAGMTVTACAGGGSHTPTGSYVIPIVATSGTQTASTSVTLVVP